MNDNLFIPILIGTSRSQRESIKPARLIFEIAKTIDGITTEFVDPTEFNFPGDGDQEEDKDPRYSDITNRADGFFIVTPEYNHSFPGSLKRMLDTEYQNYRHKPVAFAGVSSGNWGGVRAIEALVTTCRKMGFVTTLADVHFPNVKSLFDESGNILDPNYDAMIRKSFDELIWMARALKNARNAS